MVNNSKIFVLGCGVVGLNTALRLQKDIPDAEVTIIADSLAEDVVSNVAAGFFRATTSIRGPTPQITDEWLREAWSYYKKIRLEYPQGETGICDVRFTDISYSSAYILLIRFPLTSSLRKGCRRAMTGWQP